MGSFRGIELSISDQKALSVILIDANSAILSLVNKYASAEAVN